MTNLNRKEAKKKKKSKKEIQDGQLKKTEFFNHHQLIDAKDINLTQPIWLSGCPT